MLLLAQGLEEDLMELHRFRPRLENSATLDVFTQGLVRAWKDMGFSDEEIEQALRAGAERDFDLDPAWDEQRMQRQAWAAASAGSLGQWLNRIQAAAVVAAVLGFMGAIPSAALWSWHPARALLIACTGVLFVGMGLAWLTGRFQAQRQMHHFNEMRRGLSDR